MNTENASPQGESAAAGAASQSQADANDNQHVEGTEGAGEAADQGSEEGDASGQGKKTEKTAEQREIERLRRRVDSVTRKRYDAEARADALAQQQQQHKHQNTDDSDDDEPVSMTRAELNRHIAEQAKQLAPSMRDQQAVADRRAGVISTLEKDWGAEKFNALASDLDDAFGGLADRSGSPKPATDAIFESDDIKGLIEYLADPDNADEAESLAGMSAVQAGRAIARLEDKLKAAKAQAKPQPSNAAQPLEPARAGGKLAAGMPDPSNTKAYMAWANAQERAAR